MRLDEIFGGTVKTPPAINDPGTRIAIKAGLIRYLDKKIYILPLGNYVFDRIEEIVVETFNSTAAVQLEPGDGSLHELDSLISNEIKSYRQLPGKFFVEGWIRSGLSGKGLASAAVIRMQQQVYLEADEGQVKAAETEFSKRYKKFCSVCGLNPVPIRELANAKTWIVPHELGQARVLACPNCGYYASMDAATTRLDGENSIHLEDLEEIYTPGAHTMQALAEAAQVDLAQTMKVVMVATENDELIFALIRGDRDVNLPKIKSFLGCETLRAATETEIKLTGADPGFASPIGLNVRKELHKKPGIIVLADESIMYGKNFVVGANRTDYHLIGANPERDFQITDYLDLNLVVEGDQCPECEGNLEAESGIKLADWGPSKKAFNYTNEHGEIQEGVVVGGRLFLEPTLACLLLEHAGDGHISWPQTLAPFEIHIISIRADEEARALELMIDEAGFRVLLDDRSVSAGMKFNDADLIGCPIRITISQRSLEAGGVEVLRAGKTESETISLHNVLQYLEP